MNDPTTQPSLAREYLALEAKAKDLETRHDKLSHDMSYLCDQILLAAREHDLCDEYDEFVERVNLRFKAGEHLLKRATEIDLTFTVTVRCMAVDGDPESDFEAMILNSDHVIYEEVEAAFNVEDLEVEIEIGS